MTSNLDSKPTGEPTFCLECWSPSLHDGRSCQSCDEAKRERTRARRLLYRNWNRPAQMLRSAKKRAKRYGLPFSITLADVVIPDKCPVLGLRFTEELGNGWRTATSPSLDRKDNTLGYVPGNVWVISWRANTLKSDATLKELRLIVKAVEEIEREKRSAMRRGPGRGARRADLLPSGRKAG